MPIETATPFVRFIVAERATTRATLVLGMAASIIMIMNSAEMSKRLIGIQEHT
jgi:hypothetical protein